MIRNKAYMLVHIIHIMIIISLALGETVYCSFRPNITTSFGSKKSKKKNFSNPTV